MPQKTNSPTPNYGDRYRVNKGGPVLLNISIPDPDKLYTPYGGFCSATPIEPPVSIPWVPTAKTDPNTHAPTFAEKNLLPQSPLECELIMPHCELALELRQMVMKERREEAEKRRQAKINRQQMAMPNEVRPSLGLLPGPIRQVQGGLIQRGRPKVLKHQTMPEKRLTKVHSFPIQPVWSENISKEQEQEQKTTDKNEPVTDECMIQMYQYRGPTFH